MTTLRIEERVDEFLALLMSQGLDRTFAMIDARSRLINELKYTEERAHQAGIDEAVELLKEKRNGHCGKKDCLQAYCINRKIIREFCDDTIKALQDNK